MIPYGKQDIDESDVAAVTAALHADFITQGPRVEQFERAIAERVSSQFAIAANSATSCLHLACLALGLTQGDILWTSPITFVASANCGLYCGASVDFVDIDPQSFNLCPQQLAAKLEIARQNNTLPKVLVVVHMCGQSADMKEIAALARQYNIRIIEDASHALGAQYQGQAVGCGQFSDITVFSFHPVKMITCAEGGMAVTNHPDLAQKMAQLRSHGIIKPKPDQISHGRLDSSQLGDWYYEQQALGFNYRMTELQAALGLSQLQRLDSFLAKRAALAANYERKLAQFPITLPKQGADRQSAWHLYAIQLAPALRKAVFDELRAQGIGVQVHYIPVHTQPFYRELGFKWGDYPNAEAYYLGCFSLPLYTQLTDEQQDWVIAILGAAIEKAQQRLANQGDNG